MRAKHREELDALRAGIESLRTDLASSKRSWTSTTPLPSIGSTTSRGRWRSALTSRKRR